MKRNLLLLFACLFGALGGVKAWTSVVPYNGRTYYLYNPGTTSYWYGTNATYTTTANIADATPITVESGHKLAFQFEGTTYRISHNNGTLQPWRTDGTNFTFEGGPVYPWGYQIRSDTDHARWMCPDGTFQQNNKYYNRDWQFISVYELDSNTPDACASAAEASYLSAANGWERVTDNATLEASLSDYFFAIVCANYPGLMVNMADGNASQQAGGGYTSSKSMWYSNSANPEADNSFLWMIEKCNESGYEGYTFRNASYPSLTIQAEGSGSDYAHTHDQPNPCRWSSYALTPTSGVYTIKTLANGGDNYLGLWTPSNDYINGQELAGNKGTAEQGKFLIYRKLKKDVNMTSLITNPSFETGDLTGWNAPGRTDTGAKKNSDNTYKISNGDAVDGDWLFNSWGGTEENSVSQTISLPKGTYRLSALLAGFNGETLTLSAGGQSSNVVVAGDKTYGYTVSVKFTLTETSNVTIKASNTKSQQTSDASFIKADNFRLTYLGVMATDADYTALQNAIENAETKVLGFDDGEYAPYNNVAVLKALADAKAIDKNVDNLQMDVQDATAAIANVNWTVNSGEVNAIYDGTFSNAPIADATAGVNGWSAAVGLRQLVESNVEGSLVNKGMYVWGSNVVTYGETSGYQMPLKRNTVYKLTYNRASWSGGTSSHTEVTITNPSGDALGIMSEDGYAGDWNATSGTLVSSTMYFVANEDGNYKISFSPWGNTVYTNLELKSTDETLTFADNSIPKYIPGTYPNVSYTRSGITLNKKRYATVFLPYSFSTTGLKVMEYSSREGEELTFTPVDETVANTPYLVRVADGASDEDLTSLTLSGSGAVSAASGTSGDVFVGTYSPLTLYANADGYNYYGFSSKNGDFRRVSAAGNDCDAFRAYVKLPETNNSRVVVRFDDETTGIVTLDASGNINGAEVMQDGKYLIDGKIVIVKNGVKYDANGKKLN